MTRPKARYVGDGAGVLVPGLPESLKAEVRRLLPQKYSAEEVGEQRDFSQGSRPDWRQAHPSDGVVAALMSVAYDAKASLDQSRRTAISKEELAAEFADLKRDLEHVAGKLTSISLPLLRLLPNEADFLGVADQIDQLVLHLRQANGRVANANDKKKASEVASRAAKHLARDVLDIFEADGLPLGNSVSASGTPSLLIRVLAVLGPPAGLERPPHTWKRDVMAAKAAKRGR